VLFILYVKYTTFEIDAFWWVGGWVAFQVLYAYYAPGNVAYAGHFGGLLAGCALAALLRSPVCEGTNWWLDPAPPGGGAAAVKRLKHARTFRGPSGKRKEPVEEPGFVVVLQSLEEAPSQVA